MNRCDIGLHNVASDFIDTDAQKYRVCRDVTFEGLHRQAREPTKARTEAGCGPWGLGQGMWAMIMQSPLMNMAAVALMAETLSADGCNPCAGVAAQFDPQIMLVLILLHSG